MNKIRYIITAIFILISIFSNFAQEFLTPADYFDQVSSKFSNMTDYQAIISIYNQTTDSDGNTQRSLLMKGNLIYRNPDKLRIDFTSPGTQVFVTNGEMLIWYIPAYSFVLQQKLRWKSPETMNMLTAQGLQYIKNNYNMAYTVGPDPVPLDTNSGEMVYKLKCFSSSSSYRQLEISITLNGMIRRVIGTTYSRTFVIDYENISINRSIPLERFDYTPPPNANVYENFLYEVIE